MLSRGGHDVRFQGGIATLERVTLNGSQQWIAIRGSDASGPALFFLAGGPGMILP
jgi:hypothetical protein